MNHAARARLSVLVATTLALLLTTPSVVAQPEAARRLVPETFTLDVHNVGGSPAYNVTLTDLLPNGADGGMCDMPPQNITAQVFEADGMTPVSPVLAEGTDFTTVFASDPTCSLTLSMPSPAARPAVRRCWACWPWFPCCTWH